jgi:hypothetical protein
VKPVPVIVTNVPPAGGPVVGLIAETVGAATKVNTSAGLVGDVPPVAVTVTSTAPVPAGLSAVIVVALTTVSLAAGVVPKLTAVTPVNPVPEIVTDVPPVTGPIAGLKPVTLVGVIRPSSSSIPIRKPRLVRRPSARRRPFLVENRDVGTNDDMEGSPGDGRGHVILRRSEDAVATY